MDDVERLAAPQASYDAVLCMGVLEYLPRYSRALAEISRVLKPGGIAVIALPNRASVYHVTRSAYVKLRALERRVRGKRNPYRLAHNRCVPWQFDRELAAAGLAKLDSKACNFMFFPLQEMAPQLADSLNRALVPLAGAWFASWMGAQYIVKVQKTAWPSASSA